MKHAIFNRFMDTNVGHFWGKLVEDSEGSLVQRLPVLTSQAGLLLSWVEGLGLLCCLPKPGEWCTLCICLLSPKTSIGMATYLGWSSPKPPLLVDMLLIRRAWGCNKLWLVSLAMQLLYMFVVGLDVGLSQRCQLFVFGGLLL